MIKIIINGCQGKMGKVVCDLTNHDEACQIIAGIDVSPQNASVPFPTYEDIFDCDMPADVIIDFSTAEAVRKVTEYAVSKKIALVECTTGLSDETLACLLEASKSIPVFRSANLSLGINLIASIAGKMAEVLIESGFDIEILERHHNQKIDSPSGTAFLLGDSIKEAVGGDYYYKFDRSQTREKRDKNEIGMTAVRGGTIVGEHSIIFAGRDEVIELKHQANSKEVFAVGALRAAKFTVGKPAGMYSMKDIF